MGNKYYTPSIEELYIGFECEITWDRTATRQSGYYGIETVEDVYWYNQKLELLHIQEFQDKDSQYSKFDIRVKYLDKEDIESLGFEYRHSGKRIISNTFYHSENGLELYHNLEENEVVISHINNGLLFVGKIKNKSELVRILNMVGVI